MLVEINIDALIGPTHHYGGLGVGNLASLEHRNQLSNPRQAALEGLAKAALVRDAGIVQFLWSPPRRPNRELLQQLGFTGPLTEQIVAAYQSAPRILSAAFSSAFMWAANSATVTPAVDARDGCYHFTPANLISSLHRASEAKERRADLANMFPIFNWHVLHEPLPAITALRDEGAANHMRLSDSTGEIGFNIFVYGEEDSLATPEFHREELRPHEKIAAAFMPRQTRSASEAIARQHRLDPATTFFLRQNPAAIAAGVFHNDVIATSHQGLLIHHELAYLDAEVELARLEKTFVSRVGKPLVRIVVSENSLSLTDAVKSYLFNGQLLNPMPKPGESDWPRMVFVCPQQCQSIAAADRLLQSFIADPNIPIDELKFVAVGQSMAGGGGPACLRLRVPADRRTSEKLPSLGRLDHRLHDRLADAIEKSYPDKLSLASFCDPRFIEDLDETDRVLQNAFLS